ncbi:MAG: Asparagine synthetase [glutamine-hydrolyzing] 1 [Bacteroidia bacterium]|nr:Asparagine synthetase [glutamine-hydrolyzing] 1 [Bacteroidia bacterium]
MCGIAGYFSPEGRFNKKHLETVTNALAHRGPDASGYFLENAVGLGHRRLSIIDLSEAANQPFFSRNKRFAVVFNGEIYNYKEVETELKKSDKNFQPRTSSDTEIITEAFVVWGVEFVHKLNGMFTIAVYDREEKSLFLFRDRMGIKPVYYHYDGHNFVFASEIKALTKIVIDRTLNLNALKDYLFLEYVPGEQTIFKNISKLSAGFFLKITEKGIEKKQYYDIADKYLENTANTEDYYKEQFTEHLRKSVKYQSISDVPIGAFLSGGTDSSLICSIFQEQNTTPVNTFTIGFDVKEFDETAYAGKVAEILKTNHSLTRVGEKEALGIAEHICDFYDQPFAAPSTIPSYIVCKKAREHVTVALSGDGGDELFMGYGYYNWQQRIDKLNAVGGYPARKLASTLLNLLGNQSKRAARVFDYSDYEKIWLHIWSQEQYMFSENEISSLFAEDYKHTTLTGDWRKIRAMKIHPFEQIALFDIKHYLADNLLYKMDIASMASSLEVRVPYLDHNLVEFAVNVPLEYKINKREQKYLMKKALRNYLPDDLIYRKKWGFPAPLGTWLQSELSFMIDKYLSKQELEKHGLFNHDFVKKLVSNFRSGETFHYKRIWALIVFQMWFNRYMENEK